MNCRRHGSKPTIALWMLVAVADLAILIAAAGLLVTLLVLAGLALVAFRLVAGPQRAPAGVGRRPAQAVARRRA